MAKQKLLMRIAAPEVTPVIQDLRVARTVVEMLFLATPSMQKLLLGHAIATEEAVAHVLLEVAAKAVGRPNDPAIGFSLVPGEAAIVVFDSGEEPPRDHVAAEPNDASLLTLTPRGEA